MIQVLITGADGQVGKACVEAFAPTATVTALNRAAFDITDQDAIDEIIGKGEYDVIINTAAYTAVDQAEDEPDRAMAINGIAPGLLANAAKRTDALLVHYSTDYVFDGKIAEPYTEEDRPNPLSVYGGTKRAGEQAVMASGAAHLIFRTSWVYDRQGRNFFTTIRRLAKEREELSVVDDQYGAPTTATAIAVATAQIIGSNLPRLLTDDTLWGVYHMTCAGKMSWAGFARKIVESGSFSTRINPIPATAYPVKATRPTNSILSNEKLESHFRVTLPTWDDAFATELAAIANV
jgi:dTDP-4-dehydrorhamnose reductase